MGTRASAAILPGNTILMVRHEHDGRQYSTLPGGGVEAGLSPEKAAVSKVREEAGLDARVARFLFEESYLNGTSTSQCFLLEVDAAQVAALGEVPEVTHTEADSRMPQEVAWLPLRSLGDDHQVSTVLVRRRAGGI